MAASFGAAGTGTITATSGAACTPANPTGIVAGHLLIAHVFFGGSTTAPDTPADWALLDGPRELDTPATNGRTWVFGKIAVGGDANPAFGTQAVTTPRRARVYRFTGVLDDTAVNVTGGWGFGTGATTPVADTGVTTGADSTDYLAVNLIAGSDDTLAPADFTGETGGDWATPGGATAFTSTTGTPDTWMNLMVATVAPSTTINGGSGASTANDPWGVTGFYIRSQPPRDTAPTMVDSDEVADWHSTATPRSTGSVAWQTGDVVVVHGVTADVNTTLGTPTVTGLTFAALPGSPTGSGSSTLSYAWSATAASDSSGAIQGTMGGITNPWGIAVEVWRGSDGIGNVAVNTSTTKTVSLTRSDDKSGVSYGAGDWSASAAASTFTPGGATVIETDNGDASTYASHVGWWADQGAAGATSYGITSSSTGNFAKIAVEILGTVGAAAPGRPIGRRRQPHQWGLLVR